MARIKVGWLRLLPLLFISYSSFAQHQELNEKPKMWASDSALSSQNSLLQAFKRGKVNGHFRYYFANTINQGGLKEFYANAAGGGIRYESAPFYGFQFAVSGFYIFNLGSTDFTKVDAATGQGSRYEIGLFDIQNPTNKSDINRLEELYLKYVLPKSLQLVFGKQLINTPLINLQDGRMRPTQVEGVWLETAAEKKLSINGGWIWAISPRSTTLWYGGGASIGTYPMGISRFGGPANYFGQVRSSGVGVLGLHYKPSGKLHAQLWNYLIDNTLNSTFGQIDYKKPMRKENYKLLFGLQSIVQQGVGNGGNVDQTLSYVSKNHSASTFGARLGIATSKNTFTLNFNRILNQDQYIFPREWGRDPFYTFMPRERNEGYSDATAVTVKWVANWLPKSRLTSQIAAGYFELPAANDAQRNKYAFPSYAQYNLDFRYKFSNALEGLSAQLLVVYKQGLGDTFGNSRMVINKVDLLHTNVVLNFRF